ncbi:universal stress protein UspA-like protein [Halovivax ruber XH-70]|uniref:Universal stress protein UspA-like protein n=2 Tax=Halovivax TaxID=332951 RepID=L0IB76_HALRX|nr:MULTISPECIES: universal stress protein [Halovivax]AGB15207.1 universal stress protein UspA-like protein [Halovivax ruber XH-70]ELZ11999.1 UspA domain-containing protein [Halovivax asiaticus JCM 14624]
MDDTAALSVETVLAPVDGSDASTAAVDDAVELADRYDATVHVLFVLGREVVLGMDADAVEEADVAESVRTYLADVRSHADDRGVPITTSTVHGFSRERKTTHPGSVVLDTADDVDADLVVVPRPSTDGPATVLETVAEYVLGYATQPVLSV